MPVLTILAGPNGAGKSFFSNFFLQTGLLTTQPINIDALEDNVDRNLIPEDPMRYAYLLRKEIDKVFNALCQVAIQNKSDFSFECNLRKDQLSCINLFVENGYTINLIYIWLDNLQLSRQRVDIRFVEEGHPVGDDSLTTNFYQGLKNLDSSVSEFNWDRVLLFDNSKDAKNKGDSLSLLLELNRKQITRLSNNFFSLERRTLIPSICGFILEKKEFGK